MCVFVCVCVCVCVFTIFLKQEGQESKTEGWRGGAYSWAQSIPVLEAAYDICESFLDNRARLKQIPSDPRAVPQGVLNLADYWLVRPDVGALQELPAGAAALLLLYCCFTAVSSVAGCGRVAGVAGVARVACRCALSCACMWPEAANV